MGFVISSAGQSYGPFTADDIRRFVADGRLAAQDKVWDTERSLWIAAAIAAGEAPPLSDGTAMATTDSGGDGAAAGAHCGACRTTIGPGARFCPSCGVQVTDGSEPKMSAGSTPPVPSRLDVDGRPPAPIPSGVSATCPKCGVNLSEIGAACPKCGNGPALASKGAPAAPANTAPSPRSLAIIILAAVGVLAVLGVALVLIFLGVRKQRDAVAGVFGAVFDKDARGFNAVFTCEGVGTSFPVIVCAGAGIKVQTESGTRIYSSYELQADNFRISLPKKFSIYAPNQARFQVITLRLRIVDQDGEQRFEDAVTPGDAINVGN